MRRAPLYRRCKPQQKMATTRFMPQMTGLQSVFTCPFLAGRGPLSSPVGSKPVKAVAGAKNGSPPYLSLLPIKKTSPLQTNPWGPVPPKRPINPNSHLMIHPIPSILGPPPTSKPLYTPVHSNCLHLPQTNKFKFHLLPYLKTILMDQVDEELIRKFAGLHTSQQSAEGVISIPAQAT